MNVIPVYTYLDYQHVYCVCVYMRGSQAESDGSSTISVEFVKPEALQRPFATPTQRLIQNHPANCALQCLNAPKCVQNSCS